MQPKVETAFLPLACHSERSRLPSRLLAKPFGVALCEALEESSMFVSPVLVL
jgi:hypothetical protein